jgi:outer membrane phospholipase A
MAPITTSVDTHAETTRMDIHETVRQLTSHLGPTLVALLANVNDRKLPHKWSAADGPEPRDESKQRLMLAHRIWREISQSENDYTARNWFIGANPRLGEKSPAESLREGHLAEVKAAADAFLEGTDD